MRLVLFLSLLLVAATWSLPLHARGHEEQPTPAQQQNEAALPTAIKPDEAVLAAPQIDDLTLLQMDAFAHTTMSTVSALESQLESTLSQQAALEQQVHAEAQQKHSSDVDVEAEMESEHEAEAEAETETEAEVDAEAESEAEAEGEVETEAEAETETESESHADAESEVEDHAESESESEGQTEADSVAELEAQFEAQAAAELNNGAQAVSHLETQTAAESNAEAQADAELEAWTEAEMEASAETETDADSDKVGKAARKAAHKTARKLKKKGSAPVGKTTRVSGHVSDSKTGKVKPSKKAVKKAVNKAAKKAAKKAKRKAKKAKKAAKKAKNAKKGWRRRIPTDELKIKRTMPNGPATEITLPNGKKLFRSNVVDPNIQFKVPKPKKVLRHSKERVLSAPEGDRLAVHAKLVQKPEMSAVRKEFLRLNPEQREKKLRARSYSPSYALLKALKGGLFAEVKFDPPTSMSHSSVTQHLTVRHHAPSVRQRAEIAALRAAARTMRRINAKQAEYSRAITALRTARNSIQRQVHQHLVLRALQAKKLALRAARRAAWSGLLQHRNLRRDLLAKIARALGKGHLSGEARKQAIAALLKRHLTPVERSRLHAFIKGHAARARHQRHQARGKRHSARRAKKLAKKAKTVAAVSAAKNAIAAAKSNPALSAKDKAAVDALIKRIQGALAANGGKRPPTPIVKDIAKKAAAPKKVAKKATPAKKDAKAPTKAPAKKDEKKPAAPAKKPAVSPRFARVAARVSATAALAEAESVAAEAEEAALQQLNTDSEVDEGEDIHTEAMVQAATETTDEWLREHGVDI